jgi:hypothetical protein
MKAASTTIKNYARDPSFRFDLKPSAFKKYECLILIYSKTESQAHRRGIWLRANVDPSILYWVKEGSLQPSQAKRG